MWDEMTAQREDAAPWWRTAESFEAALGDPFDTASPLSFARSMALDEQEVFPAQECALVEDWGLQDYYVPSAFGGKLTRFDELLALMRVVARRDLSVAIAHSKTYLGSAPVWIAGSQQQREALARRILNREYVALALTEAEHGGDLGASECVAIPDGDDFLISGTKWIVNNATRSAAFSLLARTQPRGGPLGVSLFLVEKDALAPGACLHLPKIHTHGIRGIDISGVRLVDARLPRRALIGKEHRGLETVLKTFQITRTLCSGLSLGAADTAIRIALTFAQERRIYGDTVFAIPAARDLLAGAFTSALIADCVATSAVRALHVAPEQMSLWSSVTKYLVPTTAERLIQNCALVLGARYYLREHYAYGVFQKLLRDNAIVSLFDGSTQLNLSAIASQLGQLAYFDDRSAPTPADELDARLEQMCSFHAALPSFDVEKLALSNRGRDDFRLALAQVAAHISAEAAPAGVNQTLWTDTQTLMLAFEAHRVALDAATRELVERLGTIHLTSEGFDLARRHAVLHAASACYHVWRLNRSRVGGSFAAGAWLVLALIQLYSQLSSERLVTPTRYAQQVARDLAQLGEQARMLSIAPFQIADTRAGRDGYRDDYGGSEWQEQSREYDATNV